MKLLLYGKNALTLKEFILQLGFEVVEENPDVVISYGGDGTLLTSERLYPGIPKLPIRDSKVCKKCSNHTNEILLESLFNNKIELKEVSKLETEFEGNKLFALNDIVLRNAAAFHAIRFKIYINDFVISDKIIIGDGIVASTPFGSTGYYQSITRSTFDLNFKMAFNNTVISMKPIEFSEIDQVKIEIVRGPAQLTCDNNPEVIELVEGNVFIIHSSTQKAKIYSAESLRCNNCEVKREFRLD